MINTYPKFNILTIEQGFLPIRRTNHTDLTIAYRNY